MLQQRFIELGEGYADIYELCELMKTNHSRLFRTFIFSSEKLNGKTFSFAAAFQPAGESHFMPIYICREGIQEKDGQISKRRQIFEETATQLGITPVPIDLKHSSSFAEKELFYQYITGILRLNNLLPPLH